MVSPSRIVSLVSFARQLFASVCVVAARLLFMAKRHSISLFTGGGKRFYNFTSFSVMLFQKEEIYWN